MKVINLFAGPGAGKSTTAAGLFHLMKTKGMSVELVTEYAKEVVWDRRFSLLNEQLYLLAKQLRRLERLVGQVDYAVTDSPLLLSNVYVGPGARGAYYMVPMVQDIFSSFNNENFFIKRVKPYQEAGRTQTEVEARGLDQQVRRVLEDARVPYLNITGDASAPQAILDLIT